MQSEEDVKTAKKKGLVLMSVLLAVAVIQWLQNWRGSNSGRLVQFRCSPESCPKELFFSYLLFWPFFLLSRKFALEFSIQFCCGFLVLRLEVGFKVVVEESPNNYAIGWPYCCSSRQTKHRGKVGLSSQVMPVKNFSSQRNQRHPPPLPQFMNLNVNHVDKRTVLIYIDSNGNWHRASKGSLEQIMNLCNLREDAKRNIHAMIDKFAEKGPRSLAVTTTPNSASTIQPVFIPKPFRFCFYSTETAFELSLKISLQ
ncbi:hypothetical protein KIW84_063057 [Lathyrus oleraceus]|uniref:Uncharacterized protein n=1 Tax=Pisum sativum TaxID=3888 RepID=A0A9D4W928_PEA|nr:hypothetical protein KIW84_063057 [Pisum sativum]